MYVAITINGQYYNRQGNFIYIAHLKQGNSMCFTLKYTGKHLVTIIEFDIVYVIIQFNTFYYKYYIIQYYKIRYYNICII